MLHALQTGYTTRPSSETDGLGWREAWTFIIIIIIPLLQHSDSGCSKVDRQLFLSTNYIENINCRMLFTVAGETSEGTKPATPAGKDEPTTSEEPKDVKEEKDEQVRSYCGDILLLLLFFGMYTLIYFVVLFVLVLAFPPSYM